jgi:hypothetical protein
MESTVSPVHCGREAKHEKRTGEIRSTEKKKEEAAGGVRMKNTGERFSGGRMVRCRRSFLFCFYTIHVLG